MNTGASSGFGARHETDRHVGPFTCSSASAAAVVVNRAVPSIAPDLYAAPRIRSATRFASSESRATISTLVGLTSDEKELVSALQCAVRQRPVHQGELRLFGCKAESSVFAVRFGER